MKKLNILPKSLREKKRYIAFEVISENNVKFGDLVSSLWRSVLSLLGEKGVSRLGLWIIKDMWDENKQTGLIRCNYRRIEEVRLALGLIKNIKKEDVIVRSLGVSGTMKSARKKYFGEREVTDFS